MENVFDLIEEDLSIPYNRNKVWYDKHGKEYAARYRKEKSHIKKKVAKSYYDRHRDRLIIESRKNYEKRRKANPVLVINSAKNMHLKRTYGITLDDFNRISNEQNNKCKICRKETKLFVDHCHNTNKVRGLICITCNTTLGHYEKHRDAIEEYIK